MSDLNDQLDRIARGGKARERIERLTDRDDPIGAFARVALDVADGNDPNQRDITDAGIEGQQSHDRRQL